MTGRGAARPLLRALGLSACLPQGTTGASTTRARLTIGLLGRANPVLPARSAWVSMPRDALSVRPPAVYDNPADCNSPPRPPRLGGRGRCHANPRPHPARRCRSRVARDHPRLDSRTRGDRSSRCLCQLHDVKRTRRSSPGGRAGAPITWGGGAARRGSAPPAVRPRAPSRSWLRVEPRPGRSRICAGCTNPMSIFRARAPVPPPHFPLHWSPQVQQGAHAR